MTTAGVLGVLRTRFETEVAAPNGLTTTHDNKPTMAAARQWFSFTISIDSSRQVLTGPIGGQRFRDVGRAIVQMFLPLATGDDLATKVLDAMRAAFTRFANASPEIRCEMPPSFLGAAVRDEAWFRRTAVIPFEHDYLA